VIAPPAAVLEALQLPPYMLEEWPRFRHALGLAREAPLGTSFLGFECRLAEGAGRIDFGTGIARDDSIRTPLAERSLEAPDRWLSLRRLCAAWGRSPALGRMMPAVFTEFDLPEDAMELPEPSLFGRLDWPRRTNWRDELAMARGAASEFLDACADGDDDRPAWRRIDRAVDALPPNGWLHGVAAMRGRPDRPARVGVWVPCWRLQEYLDRLELGEFAEPIARLTAEIPDARGPFVELALDVAERVNPRIGIEFTMDATRQENGRPFHLARLVARGLCTEARAQALQAWPGMEVVRLRDVDWPCTVVRQVSHLKFVLEPGGETRAKAYLTVTPVFRLFS
jgi:hypothetical protein